MVSKEVVGFASAFAVAGTISGIAAVGASGRGRWAVGFGAAVAALLAASCLLLRWRVYSLTSPKLLWGEWVWETITQGLKFGGILGLAAGLMVSLAIPTAVALERRISRWQFGLLVAILINLLGAWILPPVVAALPGLLALRVGGNYRVHYDALVRGAGVGAGMGALCGAVVVGLVARGLGAGPREPGQANRNGEAG